MIKKIVSIILVLVLVSMYSLTSIAASVSDLEDKKQDVEEEKERVTEEKNNVLDEISELNVQISNYENEIEELNNKNNSTILMVTHDAFSASYASRILFLKDGNIFNEIIKGEKSRKELYQEILDVIALLGGDRRNVI